MKLSSTVEVIKTTIIFTAGTSLLLWLADEITKKGLGNGVSLFIMAGIIGNLPATFKSAFDELIINGSFKQALGVTFFILFIVAYLLILVGVVFTEISERRIPIQHSQRTANTNVNDQSYLPLKLNSASVMPVIFASALTSIPGLIGQFIDKGEGAFSTFVNKYIIYTSGTGFILYVLLIIGFSFLYTLMQLNPKEMAENLDKSRAYVPGITPGERTEMYFKGTLIRLTVTGSISLAILASIPVILSKITGLSSAASLGGTGLLIVVGVALETFKQLESSAVSRSYQTTGKRRRG
jgi:preprotein translocase subunit SecY